MDDRGNNIVEGPPKWRWPLGGRPSDLQIGSHGGSPAGDSTVDRPEPARKPGLKVKPQAAGRIRLAGARPAQWKTLAVTVLVGAAFFFHALPQLVRMGGLVGIVDARGMIVDMLGVIPIVGGVDVVQTLVPAISGWLWQPLVVAFGAAVLRLVAISTARRDPLSALWIAGAALLVDLGTWLFMGLKLSGVAFTEVEGEALMTMLRVEGAALLILFFILAPTGKKRPGKTDAA